jgi:hypothetical protein
VSDFKGERKRSTRPAIQLLTAGTARAVFRHLGLRDYFLDDQLLSTPHLYFLYFVIVVLQTGSANHVATLLLLTNDSSVLRRPVEITGESGHEVGELGGRLGSEIQSIVYCMVYEAYNKKPQVNRLLGVSNGGERGVRIP